MIAICRIGDTLRQKRRNRTSSCLRRHNFLIFHVQHNLHTWNHSANIKLRTTLIISWRKLFMVTGSGKRPPFYSVVYLRTQKEISKSEILTGSIFLMLLLHVAVPHMLINWKGYKGSLCSLFSSKNIPKRQRKFLGVQRKQMELWTQNTSC